MKFGYRHKQHSGIHTGRSAHASAIPDQSSLGNRRDRGDRGPRHAFGHGGGGRERRRMFDSGELRLLLLLLLEASPRHGYDIIREIENRTGGEYSPSPGVVYPTLTHLEELGFATGQTSEATKRLFTITEAGLAHLNENRASAEAAAARLETVRRKREAVESGPVFRAMGNLKTVLRQRLADAEDKQILFDVAEIIDEAARKIERL
jgi:DNA-binding PadR family transcriptional regulator